MLKAIVSYSKKVPAEGQFSSQGYSLSLETEISENEPGKIQAKLHDTFDLVKQTVENELANGNGQAKPVPAPAAGRQTGEKASNKQVKYITDLAAGREISLSDLNAGIQKRYGGGLYDLTKKQASEVVEELKVGKPLRQAA
ncbi:MAG: hypothetical protein K8T26_19825 [Lentisphaerae bacterium]|nr:hypothetical protein [Lentisphaerota bacterium]